MDYLPEPPRRLFCWTVCAYKRPDLSDEDYHNYMSQVHGPLVKELMVKYGIVKWSMVSFLPLPRPTQLALNNPLTAPVPQHGRNPRPYGPDCGTAVCEYGRL